MLFFKFKLINIFLLFKPVIFWLPPMKQLVGIFLSLSVTREIENVYHNFTKTINGSYLNKLLRLMTWPHIYKFYFFEKFIKISSKRKTLWKLLELHRVTFLEVKQVIVNVTLVTMQFFKNWYGSSTMWSENWINCSSTYNVNIEKVDLPNLLVVIFSSLKEDEADFYTLKTFFNEVCLSLAF